VREVQHLGLCVLEHLELGVPPVDREVASLQVLATEHLVHALEPSAYKPQRDGHAQELVRVRLDEVVER